MNKEEKRLVSVWMNAFFPLNDFKKNKELEYENKHCIVSYHPAKNENFTSYFLIKIKEGDMVHTFTNSNIYEVIGELVWYKLIDHNINLPKIEN